MKNGKAIFLSAAVILGATGLIAGNHVLASGILAAGDTQEPAIIMQETVPMGATELYNVGMYSNADGIVYMAMANGGANVTPADEDAELQVKEVHPTTIVEFPSSEYVNPTDGNLNEEEAKQVGIDAIIENYGLTQKDLESYDITVRGSYAADWPSAVPDRIVWQVDFYPSEAGSMNYSAVFDDNMENDILVHGFFMNKEGTPLDDELSSDKAQELAIAAIVEKYALTQETLERFTVTVKYYEVTEEAPGRHAWWVNLYPANNDDFSEIGCYWTYLDAETGEILQLNSAANGKG